MRSKERMQYEIGCRDCPVGISQIARSLVLLSLPATVKVTLLEGSTGGFDNPAVVRWEVEISFNLAAMELSVLSVDLKIIYLLSSCASRVKSDCNLSSKYFSSSSSSSSTLQSCACAGRSNETLRRLGEKSVNGVFIHKNLIVS
eukprot:762419-Hanusia_phi.AAC.2